MRVRKTAIALIMGAGILALSACGTTVHMVPTDTVQVQAPIATSPEPSESAAPAEATPQVTDEPTKEPVVSEPVETKTEPKAEPKTAPKAETTTVEPKAVVEPTTTEEVPVTTNPQPTGQEPASYTAPTEDPNRDPNKEGYPCNGHWVKQADGRWFCE